MDDTAAGVGVLISRRAGGVSPRRQTQTACPDYSLPGCAWARGVARRISCLGTTSGGSRPRLAKAARIRTRRCPVSTLPTVTEKQIRSWVGETSYGRGVPYARDGAIFDARRQ